MSFEPLVSVIIPTRNRAELLKRALQSVLQQTHRRLEIVVVDDDSLDSTPTVVKRMSDPRIRYLRHPRNLGGGAARNTGIRSATGEFIAFLDDDDEWTEAKTAEQLNLLEHYDAVVCTASDTRGARPRSHNKCTLELNDLRSGPWGGTGVLMARAKVLKDVMFDESLSRGQDWDLFIRIALKYRIGYLDKPLLRYNAGGHSRITNNVPEMPLEELDEQFRTVHKYRELFGDQWHDQQMARALLNQLTRRRDGAALLIFVVRRYGPGNAARALFDRSMVRLRRLMKSRISLAFNRVENG